MRVLPQHGLLYAGINQCNFRKVYPAISIGSVVAWRLVWWSFSCHFLSPKNRQSSKIWQKMRHVLLVISANWEMFHQIEDFCLGIPATVNDTIISNSAYLPFTWVHWPKYRPYKINSDKWTLDNEYGTPICPRYIAILVEDSHFGQCHVIYTIDQPPPCQCTDGRRHRAGRDRDREPETVMSLVNSQLVIVIYLAYFDCEVWK